MAGPHNVVQVYLGWVNSIFNERGVQIASLSELHNGRLLFELLAALSSSHGGHDLDSELASLDGKSSFEAVAEVFRWLGIFGVRLSISAADVANGSMKALLDILWEMILHLTIHSPDRRAAQRTESIGAKLLMEWCSRMLGDVTFDYRKSITENLNKETLSRLINKCFDATASSPKGHSSSFFTAVTEAESRLGVSSMLLRTSNDAAAGYGLMVYVALLRRKVELATAGKPLLKKDDYRRDAVQRAALDASVRQQLKLQQERTQQVLKDLENQLDSFKKLRQDSGVASQSKLSGDMSFTGTFMEKSLGSTSPGIAADDDTLRASHANFDTVLHDALSVDLSAFSQVAHTDAPRSQSLIEFFAAADGTTVCPEPRHGSVMSNVKVHPGLFDDNVSGTSTSAAVAFVPVTLCTPTAPAAAVCSSPDVVEQGNHSATATGRFRAVGGPSTSSDQRSSNSVAVASWPSKSQPLAMPSQLGAFTEPARFSDSDRLLALEDIHSSATANRSASPDHACRNLAASTERDNDGFSDHDVSGHGAFPRSRHTEQLPVGVEKPRSRRASMLSTSTAASEHVNAEERAEHAGTAHRRSKAPLPIGSSRSGVAGHSLASAPDRNGIDVQAFDGCSPELHLSLFMPHNAGGRLLLPPPVLESTSYADSDDFLLAWLTSSPDSDRRETTSVEERGAGVVLPAPDDVLMVTLDKIGRRNEVILSQLHDSRRRELELLRRLTERDDLIVRLHGSLLLQQQRLQQKPSGARHRAGTLAAGGRAEETSRESASAERNYRWDEAGAAGLDGEREWYRHTVVQLHDELARCRFQVIAPLQDENRMLRKRLQLLEEQHVETFSALQDERLAQERLIVSLQLEMSRFDRLMASGIGLTSIRGTSVVGETRVAYELPSGLERSSVVPRSVPRGERGETFPSHNSPLLLSAVLPKDRSVLVSPAAPHVATVETECMSNDSNGGNNGDLSAVGFQKTAATADRTTSCTTMPVLARALVDDTDRRPEPGLGHEFVNEQGSRKDLSVANKSSMQVDAEKVASVSATGNLPASVCQQLAHFRELFDSAEPLDDDTIVGAAFSLLNESISQRMASSGLSSSSSPVVQPTGRGSQLSQPPIRSSGCDDGHSGNLPCGDREDIEAARNLKLQRRQRRQEREEELRRLQQEVIRLQALVDVLQHEHSSKHSENSSLDVTTRSPDGVRFLSTTDPVAKAEIERLRLKEEAMNRDFASKIAIMDDLLRVKIDETHSLQDANMVLTSQRDRYEMQRRQSEQECDALRAVLRQYDEARQATTVTSCDVTSSPMKGDESINHSMENRAPNAASRGGSPSSSATSSPCRRESDSGISGVQVDVTSVRRSCDGREIMPVTSASAAAACQQPFLSHSPDGSQRLLSAEPAAAAAQRPLPLVEQSGIIAQELSHPLEVPTSTKASPELLASAVAKLTPHPSSCQPSAHDNWASAAAEDGMPAPANNASAAVAQAFAVPASSKADINDAIINELAALNQVSESGWEPHQRPSGFGSRAASTEFRPPHTVRVERRRPGNSSDITNALTQQQPQQRYQASGTQASASLTGVSANGLHVSPSLRQRADITRGSARSDNDAPHVKSRTRMVGTAGSAVAAKLVTSTANVVATQAEPTVSRRNRAGSGLRRYEDGGPNPQAIFPVLLEPSRRSRKS